MSHEPLSLWRRCISVTLKIAAPIACAFEFMCSSRVFRETPSAMYIAKDETSTTHASANHIGAKTIDQSGPTGSPVCTDDTLVKLSAAPPLASSNASHFCSNKIEKTTWPQIERREVTRTMTGVFIVATTGPRRVLRSVEGFAPN